MLPDYSHIILLAVSHNSRLSFYSYLVSMKLEPLVVLNISVFCIDEEEDGHCYVYMLGSLLVDMILSTFLSSFDDLAKNIYQLWHDFK